MKAVDELRRNYPLALLCRLAGFSVKTFYYQKKLAAGPDKYAAAKQGILETWKRHRSCYGYDRLTHALKAETDLCLDRKTVYKLMKEMGIAGRTARRKYSSYKGDAHLRIPNELKRDFNPQTPYRSFVTDISMFSVNGQWVYLSPIMDLYSREIVGLSCGTSQGLSLIKTMLDDFKRNMDARGVSLAGSLLHSDMGWQYQHSTYRCALARMGMRQSMSRKGNCLDNAIIEIFFGRFKVELFYGQERKFKTAQELIDALPDMIRWYNQERISKRTGWKTPAECSAEYESARRMAGALG